MQFLDQRHRILTVAVVGDDALTDRLVIDRFSGSDYLSRDFHYDVLLLSEDADIALEDVQGRMMLVWLTLPNGGRRPFTGLVKFFEFIDRDMRGICSYRAQLVPWTDYATLRSNCRVHLATTREQQFAAILEAYAPVADWQWKVPGDARNFTMCVQFNETDRNYLNYRLELDGTPYRFEHHDDAAGDPSSGHASGYTDGHTSGQTNGHTSGQTNGHTSGQTNGQTSGHTMVVFGSTRDAEPISGDSPEVRFHPDRSQSIQQHAITKWSRHAQWGHGTHLVSSYDFKKARAAKASVPTLDHAANVIGLTTHEFVGNYGFINAADGDRLAQLRMEETEVRRQQMQGHSTNPYLQPGRWFRLTEHPDGSDRPSENEYVVSEVHYEIKNNFLVDDTTPPSFKNTFLCHPRDVPWRPGRGLASTPNIVSQTQTATVVGGKHGGAIGSVDVDEFGRVLLRFHWDIEGKYTCRVRVQAPWAGGEKGFAFHPRIGSEVVVAFEMGNPDSPIVQGGLANTDRMPAWKLPEQSHISGMRSRQNTAGGGNSPGSDGNHMLFDDTPGKLHWQAFSSHHYSQVGLGFLSYIDGTTGRTRARGQGFEIRTDGHGSTRAARGLLQTTDSRTGAISHVSDIREAVERLNNAQDLHGSLSDAAQSAGAHDSNDQSIVVHALQNQTAELKGSGGDPASGEFPEFSAPHIVTSSAAGIASVAEGSTHIVSNEHTAFTSGGHASISAGKSLLASVKDSIRFFAYKSGMKLISANADIDMQALKTSINLLAKLNITVTADCIDINAKTRLSLSGGGSNITLTAGDILQQTAGHWQAHAANFDMSGPASVGSPALPKPMQLPLGQLDVLHRYVNQSADRVPQAVRQAGVSLVDADGATHAATLDGNGFKSLASIPMGMAEVTYERDPRDPWGEGSYLGEDKWLANGVAELSESGVAVPAPGVTGSNGKEHSISADFGSEVDGLVS